MNIIVLCGGLSAERDVSLVSGRMVAQALRRLGHRAVLVDLFFGYTYPYDDPKDIFGMEYHDELGGITADVPDLDALRKKRGDNSPSRIGKNIPEICAAADIVFLGLHGEDGEDGKIQALFDLYGIKYTGSDSVGSTLAMQKAVAKQIFAAHGIDTPHGIVLSRGGAVPDVGLPCVVKPQSGGSSVGTSIAYTDAEYRAALELAFKYDEKVIVEDYVSGRECDVGVIDGMALPVIEICPKTGFFDYKNKYLDGMTNEYCPADIPADVAGRMQKAALEIYSALGLKVYARMDFIFDKNGRVWALEANTLPGLTPASLMPKEAAAAGIPYDRFCGMILEKSLEKYN